MKTIILGIQWGDEGKGKIVDLLAKDYHAVIRFQGGDNAGHTIVIGNDTYKLHLIPSGILYKDKICILANGVVISPKSLINEIDELEKSGNFLGKLYISEKASIIMPYHKLQELADEKIKGKKKIGTTNKGIGPCYSDKISRIGIKAIDLKNESILKEKLDFIIPYKNKILNALGIEKKLDINEIYNEYIEYGKKLSPFIVDTFSLIKNLSKNNKSILFEGAQGTLLDIDHGTYPFVTSSNTSSGGVFTGTGISPKKIDKIIGIVKAYTTRVGQGPFVTELKEQIGELLRSQGAEYGTTTGRPRRCGWLDLFMLKYSIEINGIDEVVLTKLDVLSNINPLKICVGYKYKNLELEDFSTENNILCNVEPLYKELSGWKEDIKNCKNFSELPDNCKNYIKEVENFLQVPINIISIGAERNKFIVK